MNLDLASVMLEWAAGGLLGLWVTGRHRVVGVGYGWLLRATFAVIALAGVAAGLANRDGGAGASLRDGAGGAMVVLALVALAVSVVRRHEPARIPPGLDLLAAAAGFVSLAGAAEVLGGPYALSLARLAVGAVFLGLVTDAMLLGHWYLVQPGLGREPLREMVRLAALAWPLQVAVLLIPTGMASVLSGTIDDGYGGLFGWTWIVSALTTLVLLGVTWLALKERMYSAVMAATGLLYLAILTAFGTDVLARAVLAP